MKKEDNDKVEKHGRQPCCHLLMLFPVSNPLVFVGHWQHIHIAFNFCKHCPHSLLSAISDCNKLKQGVIWNPNMTYLYTSRHSQILVCLSWQTVGWLWWICAVPKTCLGGDLEEKLRLLSCKQKQYQNNLYGCIQTTRLKQLKSSYFYFQTLYWHSPVTFGM